MKRYYLSWLIIDVTKGLITRRWRIKMIHEIVLKSEETIQQNIEKLPFPISL